MARARRAGEPALAVDRDGAVATLTLQGDRAGPRLTPGLHAALAAAAADLDLDEGLRVVVVRSARGAFCRPVEAGDDGDEPAVDGVAAVAALRVPVVALLRGDVRDAALELALACDLRIAAAGTHVGLTQLLRGSLPRHGGTQRLPRIVGRGRALTMLLLGEVLDARGALDVGLVQRVVPDRELARAGATLARELASRAPVAQRLGKEALRAAHDLPLAEGLRLEGDLYVLLQTTRDRDEGLASFRERRRPRFTGR